MAAMRETGAALTLIVLVSISMAATFNQDGTLDDIVTTPSPECASRETRFVEVYDCLGENYTTLACWTLLKMMERLHCQLPCVQVQGQQCRPTGEQCSQRDGLCSQGYHCCDDP